MREMNFSCAVELLSQVHEAEIQRLQVRISELSEFQELQSAIPPTVSASPSKVQERSSCEDQDRKANSFAGSQTKSSTAVTPSHPEMADANEVIDRGDMLSARNPSAALRQDCDSLLGTRSNSLQPDIIGRSDAICLAKGREGSASIEQAHVSDIGELKLGTKVYDTDTPSLKSPTDAASNEGNDGNEGNFVLRQWYLFVAKLLGFYRDPLKPHEVWLQSRLSQSVTMSMRSSAGADRHREALLMNEHRKTLELIEKKRRRSTHSMFGSVPSIKAIKWNFMSTLYRVITSMMIHPTSSMRLLWVTLCLLMVSYEIFLMTMTPFGLAEKKWARTFDFVSAGFWTLDVGITFRSGILIKGNKIEMRATVVAKSYIKSWFLFDCAVASIQWYSVYSHLAGSSSAASSLASLTVVRLLRLGRLSKVLKRFDFQNALLLNFGRAAYVMIYHMKVVNEVAKGLIAAILIVHCTACAWYEVGKGPDGWAVNYDHLLTGGVLNDYLICMHWSLAQFQGNVDIYPGRSTGARGFACVSMCISIVFLTFFVSTLTGTLVSLRDERKRRRRDVTTMSRFLDRQPMPSDIMLRALHYVNTSEIQEGERTAYEEDQRALELFPRGLRRQLMSVIIAPYLEKIPVFAVLKQYHANTLAAICVESITQHVCSTEEDMFTNREQAKRTYIIVSGALTYNAAAKSSDAISSLVDGLSTIRHDGSVASEQNQMYDEDVSEVDFDDRVSDDEGSLQSPVGLASPLKNRLVSDTSTVVRRLEPGDIISEAAMWLPLFHEGDLCSLTMCHCILVCCNSLGETILRYHNPWRICSDYARRFANVAEELNHSSEKRIFMDLLGARDIIAFEASR